MTANVPFACGFRNSKTKLELTFYTDLVVRSALFASGDDVPLSEARQRQAVRSWSRGYPLGSGMKMTSRAFMLSAGMLCSRDDMTQRDSRYNRAG